MLDFFTVSVRSEVGPKVPTGFATIRQMRRFLEKPLPIGKSGPMGTLIYGSVEWFLDEGFSKEKVYEALAYVMEVKSADKIIDSQPPTK